MLVPYRLYQPYLLNSPAVESLVLEGFLTQTVQQGKLRITNRSAFAPIEVRIQETENLGLSADPLFTGATTVDRLLVTLQPGEVIWHAFGTPFLEPYSQTNSAIPSIYHTISITNKAISPTLDDVLGIALYGLYEDVRPLLLRTPTVL